MLSPKAAGPSLPRQLLSHSGARLGPRWRCRCRIHDHRHPICSMPAISPWTDGFGSSDHGLEVLQGRRGAGDIQQQRVLPVENSARWEPPAPQREPRMLNVADLLSPVPASGIGPEGVVDVRPMTASSWLPGRCRRFASRDRVQDAVRPRLRYLCPSSSTQALSCVGLRQWPLHAGMIEPALHAQGPAGSPHGSGRQSTAKWPPQEQICSRFLGPQRITGTARPHGAFHRGYCRWK